MPDSPNHMTDSRYQDIFNLATLAYQIKIDDGRDIKTKSLREERTEGQRPKPFSKNALKE